MIIKDQLLLSAEREAVWEILTNPLHIKEWDDIPESYTEGHLHLGSVIEWEGYSRVTVVELIPLIFLSLKLYLPRVSLPPDAYNVTYAYRLDEKGGKTWLTIEVGDFSPLPNAEDYYAATLEFIENVKKKIPPLLA